MVDFILQWRVIDMYIRFYEIYFIWTQSEHWATR